MGYLESVTHESRCKDPSQPKIPPNVRTLVQLWERERNRLQITPVVRRIWEVKNIATESFYKNLVARLTCEEIVYEVDWSEPKPELVIIEEAYDRVVGLLRTEAQAAAKIHADSIQNLE